MTEPITPCLAEADNAPGEPCLRKADHGGRHRDADGWTWTYGHKHGRPDVYEIVWISGHVERIKAHQVSFPEAGLAFARATLGTAREVGPPRVRIYAEVNDEWRLILAAREEDIRSLRLVTDGEPVPGGAS
ncbi:hypothetical protein [Actinoplanes siamensis]|uniref:hypothetical protein n=1 Tax=Actinoplanes siamensis TaxID=1223317 RepID=UPI001942F422|nr:hypothetical protein [Actinoplanes siamensis]